MHCPILLMLWKLNLFKAVKNVLNTKPYTQIYMKKISHLRKLLPHMIF